MDETNQDADLDRMIRTIHKIRADPFRQVLGFSDVKNVSHAVTHEVDTGRMRDGAQIHRMIINAIVSQFTMMLTATLVIFVAILVFASGWRMSPPQNSLAGGIGAVLLVFFHPAVLSGIQNS